MKVLPLLLAASLVGNAAWIISSVRTPDSPAANVSGSAPQSASSPARPSDASPADSTDVIAALKAQNPETLRDLLRAAGLPEQTVRSIVGSAVWARYRERMKALQPQPDPDKPWWKQDNNDYYSRTNREQRAEIRRLQREANEESLRLLGPDKTNTGWSWQDTRYNFVSEEKRKDLMEVEQDYQDLIQEVQQDMQGFALPSDAEKIRFLMDEKKRDLAAVLTPQELEDYELRMSRTAQQLRWKMTKFDGTEDEYRKIFTLQKAFDDTQDLDACGNPMNRGATDWKKRQEDENKLKEQFKAVLGPERYTDYLRSQNYEYQQLQSAAKRLDLPPETARQVYDLRNTVATESNRIIDQLDLGVDQKKQALAALAKTTRDQIRARLGDEAAEVYMKNSTHWLTNVEQGQAVTFSDDGNNTSTRAIPPPPQPPK